MNYDRVKTNEQRNIRVGQIKTAAVKLFDTMQYHEITLTLIAKETSFTRGNLYKYISSKEDIYILVLLDEIKQWREDLEVNLSADMSNNLDSFSAIWADVTSRHQRFLKLTSIMFTILERNVTLEKLTDFKNKWYIEIIQLMAMLKKVLPHWDNDQLTTFWDHQGNYACGLYPTTVPSVIQVKATELSEMVYTFPNFKNRFKSFLIFEVHAIDNMK